MIILFIRSRNVPRLLGLSVVTAAGTTILHSSAIPLPLYRIGLEFAVPLVALAPALLALVLGAALGSPMSEIEQTAARSMRGLRLAMICVMAAIGSLLAAIPTLAGSNFDSTLSAVRNFLGFLGLTLGMGALLGSGLAWIVPLASLGVTVVFGVDPSAHPFSWAWFLRPGGDELSGTVAIVMTIVGTACATLRFDRRGD